MALRTRVNNAPASLQVTTAWTPNLASTGAFLTTDQLYWNGVTGANATVLTGGNINVGGTGGGIRLDSGQTTAVTIDAAAGTLLRIGTLGINLSTTGANLTLGSNVTLQIDANQTWDLKAGLAAIIYSLVTGAFSINFNSGGIWFMASAGNSYSGGTTIGSAVVRISSNTALGTNTVTLNTGAALTSSSTTGYTLANALLLNGTITLGDATNFGLLTFSGPTTIASTTSLSIPANYVLMQGVFGGTGAFTLSSGELDLEGATGTKSGGTTISGGTLFLGFGKTLPDQLGSDSLTINSGSAFFCGSSNSTIANTITGSSGFLYARPRNAVVTFSNASAYTGSFRIFAGASDGAGTTTQGMTLSAFPTNATDFSFINQNTGTAVTQTFKYTGTANVGAVTPLTSTISLAPTVANSVGVWQHSPSNGTATMSIAGAITSNATVAHTLQLTNDSTGLVTLSGGVTQSSAGVLALTKTGTGPVTLSGAGTFTGIVSVSAGTLNANHLTALGAASSTAGISVSSGATLSLGAALNYSGFGRSTSISGTGVSNAGALVHAFAGTANVGTINLGAAATIYGTASGTSTLSGNIVLGANVLTAGATSGNTLVLTGIISSTTAGNGLNITNDGTTALAGQNTFNGTVRLGNGTVRLDAAQTGLASGPLGANNAAASLIFAGVAGASALSTTGILEYTATNTFDYSPRFEGVAYTTSNVNTRIPTGLSVTWAGNWATNGSVFAYNIGKLGGGTLRMTSTGNTRLGTTYIYDGVVSFVSGSLSSVSFNALNATLRWESGNTQDVSANLLFPSIGGFPIYGGTFDTNGNNITFATSPWGLGSGRDITKIGLGALTLTARSYSGSGTTTITTGSIRAGQVDAVGTGSTVVIGASGTLQTLTAGGQNGKLTVAALNNSAGGIIKIGG